MPVKHLTWVACWVLGRGISFDCWFAIQSVWTRFSCKNNSWTYNDGCWMLFCSWMEVDLQTFLPSAPFFRSLCFFEKYLLAVRSYGGGYEMMIGMRGECGVQRLNICAVEVDVYLLSRWMHSVWKRLALIYIVNERVMIDLPTIW